MVYVNVAKILQGSGATSDNGLFACIEFQWRYECILTRMDLYAEDFCFLFRFVSPPPILADKVRHS